MAASMAVLSGTNYALVYHDNAQAGYTQAAFLFIFNSFFAIGWLGMTWLYPAEIGMFVRPDLANHLLTSFPKFP